MQVKQPSLVAEGMVQVTELGFQCMAKVLPSAYSQLGPILICYGPPPSQGLARQQGDSHLDNLHRLCHTRHFTKLLDIKCSVRQLLGITVVLLRLF